MSRHSYKVALRAKGIRPIPPYHRLRSGWQAKDDREHVFVTASDPERKKA